MKTTLLFLLLTTSAAAFSQPTDKLITVSEVERIERTLSSDDMEGRRAGTPGIDKAANFISAEFKIIGLQPLNGLQDFKQRFTIVKSKILTASARLNNETIDPKNIVVVTSSGKVDVNESSGFEKVALKDTKGQGFYSDAAKYIQAKKNCLVIIDTIFSRNFPRLQVLAREGIKTENTVIFILSNVNPSTYSINTTHEISEILMQTWLAYYLVNQRKRSRLFSSHYDHLGIGKPVNGDSTYNGANDDAAGSTAVIMLAKHYKRLNNNNRTLVFVTFTAEESGGYGSQYFSGQMDPAKVVAMFNLEMIGTESKWGKGSAYITGYEKTDMGKILKKNLQKTSFKFYPDPLS